MYCDRISLLDSGSYIYNWLLLTRIKRRLPTAVKLPRDTDYMTNKVYYALHTTMMYTRHNIGTIPRWTSPDPSRQTEQDGTVDS